MDRKKGKLEAIKHNFRKIGAPIRFNFRKACIEWPWAKRSDVYTHQIHNYPAKVLAYIPIYFLSTEDFCPRNEKVLDCFMGSATILLECLVNGNIKRNCLGVEINPLARLIAKVKITPLNVEKLRAETEFLFNRISKCTHNIQIKKFRNINFWFSEKAQIELTKIKQGIQEVKDKDLRDFFWVCFSSIIRKCSYADPYIPPPVLFKIKENMKNKQQVRNIIKEKQNPNCLDYFRNAIKENTIRIEKLGCVEELYSGKVLGKIIWDDARDIKACQLMSKGGFNKDDFQEIKDESMGMIITSPPYIAAQKYVRTTTLEMFWLDLINDESLKDLDKNNVGTERILKIEESLNVPEFLKKDFFAIKKLDPKRAQIVLRYFQDMEKVMVNAFRILKKDRYFILILGNNRVCGRIVKNHKLLSKLGEEVGFKTELILVDEIRSRGMITKRDKSGGIIKDEYILVLKKPH